MRRAEYPTEVARFRNVLSLLLTMALLLGGMAVGTTNAGAAAIDYPLIVAAGAQDNPAADGDRVVWVDQRANPAGWYGDIWMYDFADRTETQITNDEYEQYDPDIWGDWVVYSDTRNGNNDIYATNVVTGVETAICTDTASQQRPKVFDDIIVWEDARNGDFDIYYYRLSTGTEHLLSETGADDRSPDIYRDATGYTVGWSSGTGGRDLIIKNVDSGVTRYPITDVYSPTIVAGDGEMVWGELLFDPESGQYLRLFKMSWDDTEPVALDTTYNPYPEFRMLSVSGDKVAYVDASNDNWYVRLYDMALGTDVRVSDYDSFQSQPAISGDMVVWRDSRNYDGGLDYYDIYTSRETSGDVPVTSAGGVNDEWANHDVEVTMTVTPEAGSTIYYGLTATETIEYSEPILITAEGVTTVHYWGENVWGEELPHNTIDVRIDKTAPGITVADVADGVVYQGPVTPAFSALDPGGSSASGLDSLTATLDGAPFTSGTTVGVLGEHTLVLTAEDEAGNIAVETVGFTVETAPLPAGVWRTAGTNRYLTSVEASKRAFESAETVVIATGADWPDALGGSALAGAVDGPLLLTSPAALPAEIKAEVDRLGATAVYILGGTGAVSVGVQSELEDMLGEEAVQRIAGANRYETAQEIADEAIAVMGSDYDGGVLVATGMAFPDATAASPLAAGLGWPILLANPATGALYVPEQATDALILGGVGVVSAEIESELDADLGPTRVGRSGGANRYETAALVAQAGVDAGLSWNGVGLATGTNFPDALSGGAMLGRLGSVMLLTTPSALHPAAQAKLTENAALIDTLFVVGGEGAVSSGTLQAAKTAAGL